MTVKRPRVTEARQLPLPVALRDDATVENFRFADQQQALRDILVNPASDAGGLVYLWGAVDSGRTHLLQAACQNWPPGDALYLPLTELRGLPPAEVLAGVEQLRLVSLDDIQAVVGDAAWEEALFHCHNRAQATGCRLWISGDCPPMRLPVRLADLASRLSAALVFQLQSPGDAEKAEILRYRAGRRGLEMSVEVTDYILRRAPRSLSELLALLERLDGESLASQRALTIPFVRSSMGW
jgi:DnaA family protein